MRSRALWLGGLAVAGLFFAVIFSRSQLLLTGSTSLPKFSVLSYESFSGVAGPGPQLAKDFEAQCHCRVELLSVNDAGMMLQEMALGQQQIKIDVVVGLDQLLLKEAEKVVRFKPIQLTGVQWRPEVKPWVKEPFAPIDWAPLTFIYREGEIEPPQSWADLSADRFLKTIALQDPRLSSPGMQLVYALFSLAKGMNFLEQARALHPSVQTLAPSWSTSYGLFQRGQAKLTFSYITSLVYHSEHPDGRNYKAAQLREGHPVQIEFAGIPDTGEHEQLARDFIVFLLSERSQRQIMKMNFMYPARIGVVDGSHFASLPQLPLLNGSLADFLAAKAEAVAAFIKVMQ